jgi:peptidoglycan/LPS O-acetylase OafA/YrhL
MTEAPAQSIPSLTGIRGFAALWVLLFHVQLAARVFGLHWLIDLRLLRDGWIGVDLFFMLSGFVLMHTHAATFRSITAKNLRDFAWLRFFRIYPLATVVLLLIVVLVAFDPGFAVWYRQTDSPNSLTFVPFLKTLLLATRWFPPFHGDWNQPVWSLSVEIIGYCAFPWLAFWLTRLSRTWPLILLAIAGIAAPIVPVVLSSNLPNGDVFEWAILRMAGCFTAGIALYRLWRLWPALPPRWVAAGALAAVGAILALAFTPFGVLLDFPFAALIFLLAYQKGVVNRLLASRVALFFGGISFPLYLLHVMPLKWLSYVVETQGLAAPIADAALLALLGGLVGLAYVLHRLIETPTHRWARRRVAQAMAPLAPVPEVVTGVPLLDELPPEITSPR